MTSLTLMRQFNGIGDWLFCLAVLKFVNRQRPDVACHVDFKSVVGYRYGNRYMLPPLVPELYVDSDVIFSHGAGPDGTLATRDDLVYRKWPPDSYIESTVEHLNDQTGLGIRYEPGVYPLFRSAAEVTHRTFSDYVVLIGHGKNRLRAGKEWGVHNFRELAQRLTAAGVRVVQIGGAQDEPVTEERYLGASASKVVQLLAGARAYVGLENGIMVLAGYLGVPQITIYDGGSNPTRIDFANQLKLLDRVEPDVVAATAFDFLRGSGRLSSP